MHLHTSYVAHLHSIKPYISTLGGVATCRAFDKRFNSPVLSAAGQPSGIRPCSASSERVMSLCQPPQPGRGRSTSRRCRLIMTTIDISVSNMNSHLQCQVLIMNQCAFIGQNSAALRDGSRPKKPILLLNVFDDAP